MCQQKNDPFENGDYLLLLNYFSTIFILMKNVFKTGSSHLHEYKHRILMFYCYILSQYYQSHFLICFWKRSWTTVGKLLRRKKHKCQTKVAWSPFFQNIFPFLLLKQQHVWRFMFRQTFARGLFWILKLNSLKNSCASYSSTNSELYLYAK